MSPIKINQRDLVYLTFASNPCYSNVTRNKPSGVEINLEEGTWSRGDGRTYKIGESRHVNETAGQDNLIIGVYNSRLSSHLDLMVYTASEITRESSRGAIDMG